MFGITELRLGKLLQKDATKIITPPKNEQVFILRRSDFATYA